MSKIIAYCRVSTENQEAEGTSLETQERACVARAGEYTGPEDQVVVLREVYSGLSLDRPELNKLRMWLRAGQVKAVVVYAADRLSRDGLHLLLLADEIEKTGATLAFVTEPHESTPEGQLLTFVRGWASKLEALKIKERTTRGARERTRRGQLWGKGHCFGYLYMKGKGESRGIRIPDPEKAPIVKNIFQWYINEGLTLDGVGRRLHSLGILSPQGLPRWSDATLRRLLLNPAYIGQPVVNWRSGGQEAIEVAGAAPALVDREMFEAAQVRLRLNQENSRRRATRDYPLRGIVLCGACGWRMAGCARKDRRAYRCSKCGVSVSAPMLEGKVWETSRGLLADPAVIRAQVAQSRDTAAIDGLEARLATVERRLAALVKGEESIARAMRLSELAEDVALTQLREGKRDRESLERERASLRGQLEAVRRLESLDLEALCAKALESLEAPTADMQRLAMEALDVKAVVEGGAVRVSLNLALTQGDGSSVLRNPC
jgi:site-specific DNA recombinase